MKIFFANYRSGAWLTKKRSVRRIIWSMIIGFFAGVGGSYLLGNHFVSPAIIVLGIGGILVCAAMTGLLRQGTADWGRSAPIKRKAPRIRSEWDYRPKEKPRAFAAIGCAGRERIEFTTPEPFAINNHIWFPEDSYINAEIPSSL